MPKNSRSKVKNKHRPKNHNRGMAPPPRFKPIRRAAGPGEVTLELVTYEIIETPLLSPDEDQLQPGDYERLNQIGEAIANHDRPERFILELENWLHKYPDYPKVYNYLSAACEAAGRSDRVEQLVRLTYERFPKYLFGVVSYCHLLMRDDRTDEIPIVLNNKFSIHAFCDGRTRFHVTEFLSWHIMLAHYFARKGDFELSKRYVRVIEQIRPDHPLLAPLKRVLSNRPISILSRLLRTLGERSSKKSSMKTGSLPSAQSSDWSFPKT